MRDRLMMSLLLMVLAALAPIAAALGAEPEFSDGQWHRATLEIDAEREIPFFLWLPDDDSQDAVIRNGEEDIAADFRRTEEGFVVDFPHYDSRIEARVAEDGFEGEWEKLRRGDVVTMPFRAAAVPSAAPIHRFVDRSDGEQNVDIPEPGGDRPGPRGRFAVNFRESGEAVALIEPSGLGVRYPGGYPMRAVWPITGTVLTPTGDYRFLAGEFNHFDGSGTIHRRYTLSVFDGAHAFLISFDAFRGEGRFYSGNWWHETFTARRLAPGESVELPDPFDEVELTSGDGRLHLPALREPPYAGAPTIVQIFGTWCPNCHDEAPALVDLYDKHHADGLQILGLACEHTGDDARSRRQVERFKERYRIGWDIRIVADSDKDNASASLPDLSAVKSYPTTIWINRDGSVRAIHSGFSGPATGERHEQLLEEFERLTREIVESKPAARR